MDTVYKCSKGVPGKSNHIPEHHKDTEDLEITPSPRPEGTPPNSPEKITHCGGIKDVGQLMDI
jgi:hypothetical protein